MINQLPPEAAARLHAAIDAHLGDTFPALTIYALRDGQPILDGAWGWIDPDTRQIPVTTDTRFDLASLTKLFTTSAFLTFVSDNRIGLRAPLVEVVSQFGGDPLPIDGGQDPFTKEMLPAPSTPETVDPRRVTFWHLLTHTSGLAPWRAVYRVVGAPPPPIGGRDTISRELRWANAIRALCGYPFVGQPAGVNGQSGVVRYSDLGLMLLGEATARLHGDSLDRAIETHVTRPLGLTSIMYNPARNGVPLTEIAPTELDDDWRRRRAWGEVHDENACGVGGVSGHAGLFGTARDIAAFGQAWASADPRLAIAPDVRADALREHAQTDDARRGLGWALKSAQDSMAGDFFSAESIGHSGFTGTSLWIDPAQRLVVAIMTNRVYPGRFYPGDGVPDIHNFRRAVHDAIASALPR
ncbi:MAG: serine hydrolase domain-containing protein [Chloroflexota bacterium]|nr:serine hydrolase domain-containing protein [Chloroflexota bacterium]